MAEQQQLKVNIPKELKPVYANLVLVSDNGVEFIFDFAQALPAMPAAEVGARVVMGAVNAKRLHKALETHLGKFEEKFGEIKLPDEDLAGLLFSGDSGSSSEEA